MDPFQKFPTTQWTRLERERHTDSGKSWFCETYLPAIGSYFRLHLAHHDAEDLTQEFFQSTILSGDFIDRADRKKGSLRALLCTAASRFLIDYWRRSGAQKRGGLASLCPITEADSLRPAAEYPASSEPPDRAFDRAWAIHLLNLAIQETEKHYAQKGKSRLFEALRPLLEGDSLNASHDEVGAPLGLSPREVTLALRSLRMRVGRCLYEQVERTVAPPASVQDELRAIQQALQEK